MVSPARFLARGGAPGCGAGGFVGVTQRISRGVWPTVSLKPSGGEGVLLAGALTALTAAEAALLFCGFAFGLCDHARSIRVEAGKTRFDCGVEFLAAHGLVLVGVGAAQHTHGALCAATTTATGHAAFATALATFSASFSP